MWRRAHFILIGRREYLLQRTWNKWPSRSSAWSTWCKSCGGRESGVASRRDAVAAEIPRLRRYARALLGDDGEADDLIQDTLERALARLEQWRDGDNPRKWLFSILHNLHVDGLRRKSRRPPHVGLDSVGVEQSAPAADGASGRDLDQALQLLSGEQRQVVLLVGLEGLSYAETAEVLAIPVGTVMSRLARGRDRLRVADGLRGRRQERPRLAAEGEMTPPAPHQRDRAARLRRRRADAPRSAPRSRRCWRQRRPSRPGARFPRARTRRMRARYAGRLEEPVPAVDAGAAGAHAAHGGRCVAQRSAAFAAALLIALTAGLAGYLVRGSVANARRRPRPPSSPMPSARTASMSRRCAIPSR